MFRSNQILRENGNKSCDRYWDFGGFRSKNLGFRVALGGGHRASRLCDSDRQIPKGHNVGSQWGGKMFVG